MSALDTAVVRVCLWQLRLLARLVSHVPLDWMLEHEAQRLDFAQRELLLDMLGAWHAGTRLRTESGEKARGA